MSLSGIETLNTAYVAAVDAENWDAALKVLSKIAVRLATTPNVSRSMAGGGNQSIQWTSQSIAEQQAFCRRMKAEALAESTGIQQTKVTYTAVDATGDYE